MPFKMAAFSLFTLLSSSSLIIHLPKAFKRSMENFTCPVRLRQKRRRKCVWKEKNEFHCGILIPWQSRFQKFFSALSENV